MIDVDGLRADRDQYLVIDAREGFEYRHGHIGGALLLPSGEAWARAGEVTSEGSFAVVCGDQVRSSLVASILLHAGSRAVLVMGGMADWLERGYPLERPVPAEA